MFSRIWITHRLSMTGATSNKNISKSESPTFWKSYEDSFQILNLYRVWAKVIRSDLEAPPPGGLCASEVSAWQWRLATVVLPLPARLSIPSIEPTDNSLARPLDTQAAPGRKSIINTSPQEQLPWPYAGTSLTATINKQMLIWWPGPWSAPLEKL